jgi:hypothetical protein
VTKSELIARQRAWKSYSWKWLAGFLVVFYGCIVAYVFLMTDVIGRFSGNWPTIIGLGVLVPMVASYVLFVWLQRRQCRRLGVACPHCGAPLIDIAGQIAVATGNCGNCGEKVLGET